MTWPEIQLALDEGFTTAVIFTGSIEQHGPHLPLATDMLLGYAIGERVARRLGNALLAPVIRPGMSEHHMAFKGTISFSRATFEGMLRDTVASLIRHGFRCIALAWSHGGNIAAMAEIAPQLAAEYPQIEFLFEGDLKGYFKQLEPLAAEEGIDLETMGIHAGEVETSMMLAAYTDQVHKSRRVQGYMGDLVNPRQDHLKLLAEGLHVLTENGVLGDARASDRQRGEKYLDAIADYFVANLKPVHP
jgi:creatinine amidohydrolase